MVELEQREAVDRITRSFIGTPYHDLGEVKGPQGGVDCGKLLKLVYVEAGLIDDFEIAPYSPQHMLHSDAEQYLGYVQRFAREIAPDRVSYGDIVLWKIGRCYAHGAIVVRPGWPNIVHAHSISGCVRRAVATALHLGAPIRGTKFFSLW